MRLPWSKKLDPINYWIPIVFIEPCSVGGALHWIVSWTSRQGEPYRAYAATLIEARVLARKVRGECPTDTPPTSPPSSPATTAG